MTFVDIEKAYDRVPREEIRRNNRERIVPGNYVNLVKDIHTEVAKQRCAVQCSGIRGFAKKCFLQKSEITMEVGGWVQVSHAIFFVENRSKIALNQY